MRKNPGNPRKPGEFFVQNKDKINEVIDDYVPTLLMIKKESGPEQAYLYARTQIDEIKTKTGFDSKISCNGSCSFCCHSTIPVSYDEGEYIKKVIAKKAIMPDLKRLEIQQKGGKVSWVDSACSLLQEDAISRNKYCSIYEDRPMICRTHNSTEPVNNCDRSIKPDKFVGEIRVPLIDGIMMASIVAGGEPGSEKPKLYNLHEFL